MQNLPHDIPQEGPSFALRFARKFYGWMTAGSVLTFALAWGMAVSPEMVDRLFFDPVFVPLALVLVLIGLSLYLLFSMRKQSFPTLLFFFLLYVGLMGVVCLPFMEMPEEGYPYAMWAIAGSLGLMSCITLLIRQPLSLFLYLLLMLCTGEILLVLSAVHFQLVMEQIIPAALTVLIFALVVTWELLKMPQPEGAGDEVEKAVLSRLALASALNVLIDVLLFVLILLRFFVRNRQSDDI